MAVTTRDQDFIAIVETFPLVGPEVYGNRETNPAPDALVVETFGDKPYPNEELEGRVLSHGYGDATVPEPESRAGSLALREIGGPYYERGGVRKRTVVANSLYHGDTDYSVEIRHRGRQLMDIHAVALRFNEDQEQEDGA